MNANLALAGAIGFEIVATTALKATDGFTRPWPTALTAVGYIVSFYLLSIALRTIPTGIAYAIWSGSGIVLISLASWRVYGQKLDAAALLGMGLIVAGVVVINLASSQGGGRG